METVKRVKVDSVPVVVPGIQVVPSIGVVVVLERGGSQGGDSDDLAPQKL